MLATFGPEEHRRVGCVVLIYNPFGGFRIGVLIMVYMCMYFGWKCPTGERGIISNLTTQYVGKHKPKRPDALMVSRRPIMLEMAVVPRRPCRYEVGCDRNIGVEPWPCVAGNGHRRIRKTSGWRLRHTGADAWYIGRYRRGNYHVGG